MGAIASVIGPAFQGFSSILKGAGAERKAWESYYYQKTQGEIQARQVEQNAAAEAAAAEFSARQSEMASKVAATQADQISAAYRTELASTVSNIKAIRASSGGSSSSPSTLAYIEDQAQTSEMARAAKAGSALLQSKQSAADVAFYKAAAKNALLRGDDTARSIRYASTLGAPDGSYFRQGLFGAFPFFLKGIGVGA